MQEHPLIELYVTVGNDQQNRFAEQILSSVDLDTLVQRTIRAALSAQSWRASSCRLRRSYRSRLSSYGGYSDAYSASEWAKGVSVWVNHHLHSPHLQNHQESHCLRKASGQNLSRALAMPFRDSGMRCVPNVMPAFMQQLPHSLPF